MQALWSGHDLVMVLECGSSYENVRLEASHNRLSTTKYTGLAERPYCLWLAPVGEVHSR